MIAENSAIVMLFPRQGFRVMLSLRPRASVDYGTSLTGEDDASVPLGKVVLAENGPRVRVVAVELACNQLHEVSPCSIGFLSYLEYYTTKMGCFAQTH